ncbi:MAG: hypothetical protein V1881_03820 [Candidatus Micrarchaeota archaeon]
MPDTDYLVYKDAIDRILKVRKENPGITVEEQLKIVRDDKRLSADHRAILVEAINGGVVRAESLYMAHLMRTKAAGRHSIGRHKR